MRDYKAEIDRIEQRSRKGHALINRQAAKHIAENERIYKANVRQIKADAAQIRAILDRQLRRGSKEVVAC